MEIPKHYKGRKVGTPQLEIICSAILAKGSIYKRSEMNKLFAQFFNEHFAPERPITAEVLTKHKNLFKKGDLFQSLGRGFYKYIGQDLTGSEQSHSTEHIKTNDDEIGIVQPKCDLDATAQITLDALDRGTERLYAWWHRDSGLLAKLEEKKRWPIKVGMTTNTVSTRLESSKTSICHLPIIGLIVNCRDAGTLERQVHVVLDARNRKIEESMGDEWYETSPEELIEILKALHAIEC